MWSSCKLPTLWSSSLRMQSSFVESAGNPHCECIVSMNCPLYGVQMNSPVSFSEVWNPLELPTLFVKNVEFKCTPPSAEFNQSPHCDFQKCEIHLNSPPCFYKMWSLLELCTLLLQNVEFTWTPTFVESAWSPHSGFTKCRVHLNSPMWFSKCGVCFVSPLCFYKMRNLLELSTWFLKNAEFTWTPPPLRSPLELLSCCQKMRCSNKLPIVLLKNAEFVSTPYSIFTKCAVCLNPPLSF